MKSIAKNSFYNVIYKCLNVLFPLISTAYVSRILLPEGVGRVFSAQNIATYFMLVASLGIPTYGTKKIAEVTDSGNETNKVFSELFCISLISTFICSSLYYIAILTHSYFHNDIALYIVSGISIISNALNVDWFYQGKEEYRYIMLRSTMVKTISLIVLFLFVKSRNDYVVFALINALGKVANYLFNVIHIRKYVCFITKGLDITQHLKPVFILLAASFSIEIYTLADTTMLTFIHGSTIVGYYSTAMRGVNVAKTLITAISAVFLPKLSYHYYKDNIKDFNTLINKGFKILFVLTIPATAGIILIAEDIVTILFGHNFYNSIQTMRILALSVITVAFSNFIGYQVLVTVGKEKKMMLSTIVGACVNVILNLCLIFTFRQNGAAIASVITEACVTLVQFIYVKNYISVKIKGSFLISTFISLIGMISGILIIQTLISNSIIRLILSVTTGVIVYFSANWYLNNEVVCNLFSILNQILFRAKQSK